MCNKIYDSIDENGKRVGLRDAEPIKRKKSTMRQLLKKQLQHFFNLLQKMI